MASTAGLPLWRPTQARRLCSFPMPRWRCLSGSYRPLIRQCAGDMRAPRQPPVTGVNEIRCLPNPHYWRNGLAPKSKNRPTIGAAKASRLNTAVGSPALAAETDSACAAGGATARKSQCGGRVSRYRGEGERERGRGRNRGERKRSRWELPARGGHRELLRLRRRRPSQLEYPAVPVRQVVEQRLRGGR